MSSEAMVQRSQITGEETARQQKFSCTAIHYEQLCKLFLTSIDSDGRLSVVAARILKKVGR